MEDNVAISIDCEGISIGTKLKYRIYRPLKFSCYKMSRLQDNIS